jgi:hypothetical protein
MGSQPRWPQLEPDREYANYYVPTETGGSIAVTFERENGHWLLRISDALIERAPEGLTAAIGSAIMQMRAELIDSSKEAPDGTP